MYNESGFTAGRLLPAGSHHRVSMAGTARSTGLVEGRGFVQGLRQPESIRMSRRTERQT